MKNKYGYFYWQGNASRQDVKSIWIVVIGLTICTFFIAGVVVSIIVRLSGKPISPPSTIKRDISVFNPCQLEDVICDDEVAINDLNGLVSPSVKAYHPEKETKEKIYKYAVEYKIDIQSALNIAECESSFNPKATNPKSTAKGVYQFLDGTWKWIGAKGHQFDEDENIKQFMLWYPKYPEWWKECL